MEIRHINPNDDLLEISNIYESSWKFAYKDIIPKITLIAFQKVVGRTA